jgi:hypothetical protein
LNRAPGYPASHRSLRSLPYGEMSVRSARGPSAHRRRRGPKSQRSGGAPGASPAPRDGDLAPDRYCALLRPARSARGASQDQRPAPARRASRALEAVKKVLTVSTGQHCSTSADARHFGQRPPQFCTPVECGGTSAGSTASMIEQPVCALTWSCYKALGWVFRYATALPGQVSRTSAPSAPSGSA